jgi:DNA repair protein RecO (recombination protein O)
MLLKTKGIVLNTLKYGDHSIIVHIYTRDFGRQSYIVNGFKNRKSKFNRGYFQPLSILDLQVDHKENRQLQRIRELKELNTLYDLHTNIIKSTISLFIGEVLYRSLRENEGNSPLYDYLENSIQLLDICQNGCVNFHLVFLIQFTRFLGIYPENNLDLYQYQPAGVKMKLQELLGFTLKDLDKLDLDRDSRKQLINSIIDYYYYHLEGMGKINSLAVLHEIFE